MAEGYEVRRYDVPTKRYVQVMDLRADDELIRKYCYYHSQEAFWPEIIEGQKQVGILEMEIYLSGNHLVMIVDTPLDFCWAEAMKRLAGLPRQAEWEAFVSKFQGCDANATSDEKWQMTHRIFRHY